LGHLLATNGDLLQHVEWGKALYSYATSASADSGVSTVQQYLAVAAPGVDADALQANKHPLSAELLSFLRTAWTSTSWIEVIAGPAMASFTRQEVVLLLVSADGQQCQEHHYTVDGERTVIHHPAKWVAEATQYHGMVVVLEVHNAWRYRLPRYARVQPVRAVLTTTSPTVLHAEYYNSTVGDLWQALLHCATHICLSWDGGVEVRTASDVLRLAHQTPNRIACLRGIWAYVRMAQGNSVISPPPHVWKFSNRRQSRTTIMLAITTRLGDNSGVFFG
jgi:hypothetical protein